jgi:hypothetical protein
MATLGEYLGAGASTTKLLLHLNGNSNDSSGNGNNGTDNSITYSLANGRFRQGAGFDGYNSYITLPILSFFDSSFTFSSWVKRNNKNRTEHILYYGNYNFNNCFVVSCLEDSRGNGCEAFWDNNECVFDLSAISVTPINSNIWYNIIVTFEKISNIAYLKLYINGNLDKSVSKSSPGIMNGNENKYIGVGKPTGSSLSNYLYGSIDEVILENIAWNAEKIKKYYTMTKGRFGIT